MSKEKVPETQEKFSLEARCWKGEAQGEGCLKRARKVVTIQGEETETEFVISRLGIGRGEVAAWVYIGGIAPLEEKEVLRRIYLYLARQEGEDGEEDIEDLILQSLQEAELQEESLMEVAGYTIVFPKEGGFYIRKGEDLLSVEETETLVRESVGDIII
ncbi:hypothetical protein J7J95_03650 [bacterium]|nr:hypothetical protein [bacterium]